MPVQLTRTLAVRVLSEAVASAFGGDDAVLGAVGLTPTEVLAAVALLPNADRRTWIIDAVTRHKARLDAQLAAHDTDSAAARAVLQQKVDALAALLV